MSTDYPETDTCYGINLSKVWWFGEGYLNIVPNVIDEYGIQLNKTIIKIEFRTGDSIIDCQRSMWFEYNQGDLPYSTGFVQVRITYENPEAVSRVSQTLHHTPQKLRKLLLI